MVVASVPVRMASENNLRIAVEGRNEENTSQDISSRTPEGNQDNGSSSTKCIKEPNHVPSIFGNYNLRKNHQQHLKDLVSLQLDLIEHQQIKISRKDKQIIALRSEKEQLEARLNRMERRLALQKRHSLDPDDNVKTLKFTNLQKSVHTPSPSGERLKLTPSIPITLTSKADKNFRFHTYLKTNENFLDLADSKFLPDCIELEGNLEITSKKVSVPLWKIIPKPTPLLSDEGIDDEDISNESIMKRHSKPELEEKRRKRWDLQLLRQQRQHEMLVHKYNEREKKAQNRDVSSYTSSTDVSLDTLYRSPENVMAIEVSDLVPVCAFGHSLPSVATRELELPWFSISRRENQLRQSKQKVMKRSSRRETNRNK